MPKTPGRGLCAGRMDWTLARCFDRRSPRWRAVPAWTASAGAAANRIGCFSKHLFFSTSDIRGGRRKDLQIFSSAPSQTHLTKGPEAIAIERPAGPGVVPRRVPSGPPSPLLPSCSLGTGRPGWTGSGGISMLRNRRQGPRQADAKGSATHLHSLRGTDSPGRPTRIPSSSPRAPQKHDFQVADDGTAG